MKFSEKLRSLRMQAGLTQEQTAANIGVTLRTYQNYESGRMFPRQSEVYTALCRLFHVTADYLLKEEEQYLAEAAIRGGSQAKREVATLLSQVGGLFAGGELSEEDKDKVMKTITELYWDAKEKNQKYTSAKYKNQS